MQVLFKFRHPQATELRDLTERRVRFLLRHELLDTFCEDLLSSDQLKWAERPS